jgi:NADPH:quinone reductase-like Zn-dependent oxidoreductase
MRQIWIPTTGGPNVLELREASDPQAAAGQVRIRVEASGVNFADIMARMGLYPDAPPTPSVVGYEVGGTIDQVGSGVSTFKEGDRVASFTRFGGYSDVVVVSESQAFAAPAKLTTEQAAALPVNYLTAWMMLVNFGGLKAGDQVLVHSAGGGVGLAALQICRAFGAEVIGTASAGKHARLTEMGVKHCIDYNTEDFEVAIKRLTDGRGVDIALDPVGGTSYKKSYRSLAPFGKLAMFGAFAAAPGKSRNLLAAAKAMLSMPLFTPIGLMNHNRGVFGFNAGKLWDQTAALNEAMTHVVELVEQGKLAPVVDKVFPFDQAAAAHAYIQERRNFGKVLLKP